MRIDVNRIFGHLIFKMYHQQHFHLCKLLRTYEITPDQYALLAYLWNDDGLTQKELAALASKDQTNLAKTLERLEEIGLIDRKTHPTDGRARLVYLTEEGRSQCHAIMADAGALQTKLFADIDEQALDTMISTLAHILQNAEKLREEEK